MALSSVWNVIKHSSISGTQHISVKSNMVRHESLNKEIRMIVSIMQSQLQFNLVRIL